MMLIRQVQRWLPARLVVLLVDGGYVAVKLALVCAATPHLGLVTRLRWDASLSHPPPPCAAGPRGLKQWAARHARAAHRMGRAALGGGDDL